MFLLFVLLTWSLRPSGSLESVPWGYGTGHSNAKLPIKWSETENIKWKTKIPGRGWSSPVLWENQIWLTTAIPEGKKLTGISIDTANGKVFYQKKLFDIKNPHSPISLIVTPSLPL